MAAEIAVVRMIEGRVAHSAVDGLREGVSVAPRIAGEVPGSSAVRRRPAVLPNTAQVTTVFRNPVRRRKKRETISIQETSWSLDITMCLF